MVSPARTVSGRVESPVRRHAENSADGLLDQIDRLREWMDARAQS